MKITNGERVFVTALIRKIPGVDKNDARMVVALSDSLKLEGGAPGDTWLAEQDFTLTTLERDWLRDKINETFKKREIPAVFSRESLSLLEKLEAEE